ncbi:MAG: DUF4340 domain-containing protein [Defluviitaleaceae bacterium]|nr:DUF4340 domain-containing protein [Defluviitaleaceae bacterium]
MSKATKQLITLGIALVLIGGLAAVYFVLGAEQNQEEIAAVEPATAVAQPLRLVDRTENDLERVTFANANSFTIEAEEDAIGQVTWIYVNNRDIELDQSQVRSMMRDIFLLNAADTVLEVVDNPEEFSIGQTVITGYFRDGSQEVIRLGSLTPDHRNFYVMVDGDPALYLITAVIGNRLSQQISDLIARELPFVDTMQLTYLAVQERGRPLLEFAWIGSEAELQASLQQFGATGLTMTTPYPGRDMHFVAFSYHAYEDFEGFNPGELIEMFPQDLGRFGLDDPLLQFIMEDAGGGAFHLMFGNNHDDTHVYMMYGSGRLADNIEHSSVFLAERRFIEGLLGLNPFNFIDRFVALMNIAEVDRIVIQSDTRGRHHEMIINNYEDEASRAQIAPIVDGQEVDDRAFRNFYQIVIGITYDQEIELIEEPGAPDILITYHLLNGESIVVEFFAIDANFYAVRQQGHPLQFVTGRLVVDMMFNTISQTLLAS